ncbi:MAG: DUF1566 domain-containing protein [Sulfuricaulis sp.]|uniref:Lcl C-terminal domain-containing protein n=1 Tax=Sulfuricaulis sp. TaxID=2003553 RepID=UPI0025CF7DAE|nr:DUF1566 domain-containing protein [Sulfuricaulis sp.]MCR4347646.1 DUF1566 domain-containing protein [Sulfuricaulis sp.]
MRHFHLILAVTISLLPFTTVQAAPADLPETGQTTCTDATGVVIACAGTGQDGEHRAGVAWPNPRFSVDNTGNCMTDNLTGLMWLRSPDATARTWQQALDFANNLELCGSTDWRLPNVNELESLVTSEVSDQASFLNGQGFSGVQADSYWSSTIYAGFSSSSYPLVWIVAMADGAMGPILRSESHFVLPVRAGQ